MFFAPALRSAVLSPSLRSFDRGFERFVNDAFVRPQWNSVSVKQEDKGWTLELDLPGLAREDLSIDIEDATVRIATRAEARRQFRAAYELPEEIDAEASSAKLENGVLLLQLARKAPISKARTLAIQ